MSEPYSLSDVGGVVGVCSWVAGWLGGCGVGWGGVWVGGLGGGWVGVGLLLRGHELVSIHV